jgi:hypothetical protein
MTILINLRTYLDGIYPGLWNASVAALVVLVVWLMKKFFPNTFAKLPPSLQALPAMFVAALVNGIAALEPTIISVIGGGLLGGVTAVGVHRMLKESPLPYGKNDKPNPVISAAKKAIIMIVACVFVACAALQQGTQAACTFLDSGNPVIGAVCATVEEIESVIQHILATRAMRATHPELAKKKLDVCEAPLPPAASSGAPQ